MLCSVWSYEVMLFNVFVSLLVLYWCQFSGYVWIAWECLMSSVLTQTCSPARRRWNATRSVFCRVYLLSSFNALMLLFERRDERPVCKSSVAPVCTSSLRLCTCLIWSNSGKMARLKEYRGLITVATVLCHPTCEEHRKVSVQNFIYTYHAVVTECSSWPLIAAVWHNVISATHFPVSNCRQFVCCGRMELIETE